jgi:hypothetical protein
MRSIRPTRRRMTLGLSLLCAATLTASCTPPDPWKFANKMDLTGSDEHLAEFRNAVDAPVNAISAVTGKGLEALGERIWQKVCESIELESDRPSKPPLGVSKTFDPPKSDNDDD